MRTINKYFRWYSDLIESRMGLEREKGQGTYFESHHILPVSLGGEDADSNLILLTAREHFIAHLLLTKCTTGKRKDKMDYAMWRMCYCNKTKVNSNTYSKFQKFASEKLSERNSSTKSHKFKGYYITPWGKFNTSRNAADAVNNIISYKAIQRYCKNNINEVNMPSVRSSNYLQNEWIGKTFKELGFSFQEKESCH